MFNISANGHAEKHHEVRTSFHDEAEDSVKDHDGQILDACEGDGKSRGAGGGDFAEKSLTSTKVQQCRLKATAVSMVPLQRTERKKAGSPALEYSGETEV